MTNKDTRRTGRPTKTAPEGSRASLGLKVTAATKTMIEAAAQRSGRTQSQEAEYRIEQSFLADSLVVEALAIAYGRDFVPLLVMIAGAMIDAGKEAHSLARLHAPGDRLSTGSAHRQPNWMNDPFAFEQAAQAAYEIIEAARPVGERLPPTSLQVSPAFDRAGTIGRRVAAETIEAMATGSFAKPIPEMLAPALKDRFGESARRLVAALTETEGATK